MKPPVRRATSLVFTLLIVLALPFSIATAADPVQESSGFRKQVTTAGIREHQAAFQAIADANGGNRVAGSVAYDLSAAYVIAKAEAAGLNVTTQEFEFLFNADATPAVLTQTAPTTVNYVDGVDFASMTFSSNGDVTAPIVAVDLVVPPVGAANGNTSGCEAADFIGFPAGAIALLQRGTCTFAAKAANATAAGAVAAIVFNEGQAGRTAVLGGTLSAPNTWVPTIGTTFAVGDALRNGTLNGPTGSSARVRVDRLAEMRTTVNVIAETPAGDPNSVIVIGAHLDSVPRGPGINDNGSGSAVILEIAEVFQAQNRDVRNQLRFIWWGAEELGLIGSNYYVAQLSAAERAHIKLNLNFDMVGSPNYVRFVYDGDNSNFPVGPGAAAGPEGSGEVERVFVDYFDALGFANEATPFSGRSDYGPFIAVGIPAGGLFTGAEGVKTAEQAAVYGGVAGQQYDPCYHLACDTYANNSDAGLTEMSDAAAHATLYFSKRDFTRQPLVNPVGPVGYSPGTTGGGGLHDDHDHEVFDR